MKKGALSPLYLNPMFSRDPALSIPISFKNFYITYNLYILLTAVCLKYGSKMPIPLSGKLLIVSDIRRMIHAPRGTLQPRRSLFSHCEQ